MTPSLLTKVLHATWPPLRQWQHGPFTLRDGAGGGKRVSAASCEGDFTQAELDSAVLAMARPLILVREGQDRLDMALAARGWTVVDPVTAFAAPVTALQAQLAPLAVFPHWPPLEIAHRIWDEGGIGPARVAVMQRVAGPKTAILGRTGDRPAGSVFVACDGPEAMLHALEIRPDYRRQGVGGTLVRAAAAWAAAHGATRLSLVVTRQNAAATALYTRLGMETVGRYHYRVK